MTPAATPGAPRWAAWLVAALILAAYLPVLRAPFVFDDAGAVVGNPTIRSLSWAALRPPADGSTTTGRPVTNLSLAVTHGLGGGTPAAHRLGNVLLHVASALLLAGLLRRLAGGARASWWGGAAALLWGLHPLQTESVAGIAQRTEVLVGFFYVLALYALVRRANGGPGWAVVAVGAAALGMGSKEVMVTVPVVAVLLDRAFLAGSFAAVWRQRRWLHLGLASTWVLLAALVAEAGGQRGASAGFGLGITPWQYLLRQAEALVLYVRLSLWPHPLVLDYGTAVPGTWTEVWVPGLMVAGALAASGWMLWRRPRIGTAGAALFLILAPSSSFVPLVTQTVAEHRMYLPLAVVMAGAAWGLSRLPGRTWILVLLAAALGGVTVARLGVFHTARGLWEDTVAKVPANARAWQNLAFEHQREGRWAEATAGYARAIALSPGYVTARYNAGVVLLQQDRAAEAEEQLRAAVGLAPDHVDARANLGVALARLGRLPEAVEAYQAALRLAPAADVQYNLAVAWRQLGRASEESAALRAALDLGLPRADAAVRLGRLAGEAGDWAAAEEALRRAVRLDPQSVEGWANLGHVLGQRGRGSEAVAAFEAAVRLRPGDARLREGLRMARESAAP